MRLMVSQPENPEMLILPLRHFIIHGGNMFPKRRLYPPVSWTDARQVQTQGSREHSEGPPHPAVLNPRHTGLHEGTQMNRHWST